MKRRLHRATAPRTRDPVDEHAHADLLDLLFPSGVAASDLPLVQHVLASGEGWTVGRVRRVLQCVDQAGSPSPFTVHASDADLAYVDVDGVDLAVDTADVSVSASVLRGDYEPQIAGLLRRFLVPGATFVDIGANVGFHTAVGAAAVGSGGTVVAIEPNPDNARLLAHTIRRNGLDQVRLLPLALSDHVGHATFRTAIGSNGGFVGRSGHDAFDEHCSIVPTVTLDSLTLGTIDVVKMDVEGAEPLVICGGRGTLASTRPILVFEFSCEMTSRVGGVTPRDHLMSVAELGYDLHQVDRVDGSLVAIGDVDTFLAEWGDWLRLEDLVAAPRGRTVA
jgi:FkbM family methyltransferase